MTVKRNGDEIIIKVPKNTDLEGLQRLIDFIEYNERTTDSTANQEVVNDVSSDVNKSWWEKNKNRLLGE